MYSFGPVFDRCEMSLLSMRKFSWFLFIGQCSLRLFQRLSFKAGSKNPHLQLKVESWSAGLCHLLISFWRFCHDVAAFMGFAPEGTRIQQLGRSQMFQTKPSLFDISSRSFWWPSHMKSLQSKATKIKGFRVPQKAVDQFGKMTRKVPQAAGFLVLWTPTIWCFGTKWGFVGRIQEGPHLWRHDFEFLAYFDGGSLVAVTCFWDFRSQNCYTRSSYIGWAFCVLGILVSRTMCFPTGWTRGRRSAARS